MAATVPLPLGGNGGLLYDITHFLPRTSLRGYSGVSLISFSPVFRPENRDTHQGKTKERVHPREEGLAHPLPRSNCPRPRLLPLPRPAKRSRPW